jgi:hypothetical protein
MLKDLIRVMLKLAAKALQGKPDSVLAQGRQQNKEKTPF